MAKQKGVRMISPDKMGIGGSMSVRIEEKVKTWFGLFSFSFFFPWDSIYTTLDLKIAS